MTIKQPETLPDLLDLYKKLNDGMEALGTLLSLVRGDGENVPKCSTLAADKTVRDSAAWRLAAKGVSTVPELTNVHKGRLRGQV